MLQRVRGSVMRAEVGIEVAENSDADGVAHAGIVLEGWHGSPAWVLGKS